MAQVARPGVLAMTTLEQIDRRDGTTDRALRKHIAVLRRRMEYEAASGVSENRRWNILRRLRRERLALCGVGNPAEHLALVDKAHRAILGRPAPPFEGSDR